MNPRQSHPNLQESRADVYPSRPSTSPGGPVHVLRAVELEVHLQGRKILHVPELSLQEGQVLAVVGPNGAGKSTLLLTMAGLLFPTRGKIYYRGQEIHRKNAVHFRRKTAVVFQEPLLLDCTVEENVMAGLKLRRFKDARARARKFMDLFGISSISSQMAHTLSGGEAQKVSLARALALSPDVLFMDEPFSSLDPLVRDSVAQTVMDLARASGTSVFLVTHDLGEARSLADSAIVMKDGTIVASGSTEQVCSHEKIKIMLKDYTKEQGT